MSKETLHKQQSRLLRICKVQCRAKYGVAINSCSDSCVNLSTSKSHRFHPKYRVNSGVSWNLTRKTQYSTWESQSYFNFSSLGDCAGMNILFRKKDRRLKSKSNDDQSNLVIFIHLIPKYWSICCEDPTVFGALSSGWKISARHGFIPKCCTCNYHI